MREPEEGSRGQGGGASGTEGPKKVGGGCRAHRLRGTRAAGHTGCGAHGLLRPEAEEVGGERPQEPFCISSVICLPQLI